MNNVRRSLFKVTGSVIAIAAAGAAGMLRPLRGWTAPWNKAGFESKALADALKSLGAANASESRDIAITAPDIAENGAVVPIAVTSRIPGTQQISIVTEKNPFPLAATFDIAGGGEGLDWIAGDRVGVAVLHVDRGGREGSLVDLHSLPDPGGGCGG